MLRKTIIVALFFWSCSSVEKIEEKTFFSMNDFYLAEVARLDSTNFPLTKIACLNGKCDTLVNPEITWKEELSLIGEADINKSAWKDSYRKESAGGEINYTCIDDKLPIRNINLVLIKDNVNSLAFNKLNKNRIYSSEQELEYIPNKRLIIKGKMSVLDATSTEYRITYLFN